MKMRTLLSPAAPLVAGLFLFLGCAPESTPAVEDSSAEPAGVPAAPVDAAPPEVAPEDPGAAPVADTQGQTNALAPNQNPERRPGPPGSPGRRLERLPRVNVGSVDELRGALRSKRWIVLQPGTYDLSESGLVLQELEELVIAGPTDGSAVFVATGCESPLFTFTDCENVELQSLTLERKLVPDDPAGTCDQPLVQARSGYRLTVENCSLLGGGTALAVAKYNAFYLVGGSVRTCRRALRIRNSKHIGIEDTDFEGNQGESLFLFRGRDTRHVSFSRCRVVGNDYGAEGGLFDLDETSLPIDVIDCTVLENVAAGLVVGPGVHRLTWRGGRLQDF